MLNFIGSATDWNQPENATEPLARGHRIHLLKFNIRRLIGSLLPMMTAWRETLRQKPEGMTKKQFFTRAGHPLDGQLRVTIL